MKRLVFLGLAFLCACSKRETKKPAELVPEGGSPDAANVEVALSRLEAAAGCPNQQDPRRVWCAAVDTWRTGTATDLPSAPTMLGFRVRLVRGEPVEPVIAHHVRVAALALTREDELLFAALTELKPDDDRERAELTSAVAPLQDALLGVAGPARVAAPLLRFAGNPRSARHTLARTAKEWQFEGRHRASLRGTSSRWTIIETSGADASTVWVSFVTDRLTPVESP